MSTFDPSLRRLRPQDAPAILAAFTASSDMERQGAVRTLAQAEEMATWLTAPGRHGIAIADGADELLGVVGVSVD